VAIYDNYPVTKSHCLVIPKQHRDDFFSMTKEEQLDAIEIIDALKEKLQKQDTTINGFNIGMNCGESAGQTIFHCHIHLIPRRTGDMEEPRGGVRGVIPEKRIY
jgi:diadenosine tetraphosphate (Ap4A) HIT family hydrolase